MRFRLMLLLLILPLSVLAKESFEVHQYQLNNGLKVLVQEDHRAPVVVSQVWYKVGSGLEHGGITGVSHMLEHMMFKGTQKHPPGEFSKIIAANGGRENAFTSQDYTAYFQTLEQSRLSVALELEADRMRNLKLIPQEYEKEHQVVLEERRLRTDDQPRAKLQEHFGAVAFSNSPYRNPVIGWPDDVGGLTLEDLKAWYERWYAPNNAVLVVVGDVDSSKVFAMAQKYFGGYRASKLPTEKKQDEVEQLGTRRITVKAPAKLPFIQIGFKVPSLRTAENERDAYALEVLAGILDGGSSARMATHIVRGQQIAASAAAGYELYAHRSPLFEIEATPVEGKSIQELEKAILTELKSLRDSPVSEGELQRVKAQVLASHTYQRDSVFYQAMQLGTVEAAGIGWQKLTEYVDKVSSITAEDVQKIAGKYLNEDHMTIGYLEPLPIPEGAQVADESAVGGAHVR